MLKKACVLLLFNFILLQVGMTQFTDSSFLRGEAHGLPYRWLQPINYDSTKQYPLVLVLHGAGERGDDNQSQLVHGSNVFLDSINRVKYPAFVLFPQCPAEKYWATVLARDGGNKFVYSAKPDSNETLDSLELLLRDFLAQHSIVNEKIYVGGLSMGGMGTFELVYRNPDLFAAAFAICGGAHPDIAGVLSNIPWRIDHGKVDEVVPYILSENMVKSIRDSEGIVQWNLYEDVNHNAWDMTFKDDTLLPWLFQQKR